MGMMGRKKLAAALACAAAVVGMAVGTSSAAAFTNAPVGTSVYGNLVSPTFTVGVFTCTGLAVAGQVSADSGAGNGGDVSLSVVSPFGCTGPGGSPPPSVTVTFLGLPRTLTLAGSGGATISSGSIRVNWGTLFCTYTGTITGTFTNATSQLALGGTLARTSGSSLCPTSAAIGGTLALQGNGPLQL